MPASAAPTDSYKPAGSPCSPRRAGSMGRGDATPCASTSGAASIAAAAAVAAYRCHVEQVRQRAPAPARAASAAAVAPLCRRRAPHQRIWLQLCTAVLDVPPPHGALVEPVVACLAPQNSHRLAIVPGQGHLLHTQEHQLGNCNPRLASQTRGRGSSCTWTKIGSNSSGRNQSVYGMRRPATAAPAAPPLGAAAAPPASSHACSTCTFRAHLTGFLPAAAAAALDALHSTSAAAPAAAGARLCLVLQPAVRDRGLGRNL